MYISLAVIHPFGGNYVCILLSTDITVVSLSEILDLFSKNHSLPQDPKLRLGRNPLPLAVFH